MERNEKPGQESTADQRHEWGEGDGEVRGIIWTSECREANDRSILLLSDKEELFVMTYHLN